MASMIYDREGDLIRNMKLTRYQSLSLDNNKSNEKFQEPATHHNYGFRINVSQGILLLILFLFLLVFAGYVSYQLAGVSYGCLGAPFLYVTHHDSHNILKYTRDGCPLSTNVLWFGSEVGESVGNIRSMMIHPYNHIKNALFIANAGENEDEYGRVLVFDNCAEINGMRSYVKTLVNTKEHNNPGAQHTYSIAFDSHNNLYASFQHTDSVLRYSNTTYNPMPSVPMTWHNDLYTKDGNYNTNPPSTPADKMRNYTAMNEYYKGTFVQVYIYLCNVILLVISLLIYYLHV